MRAMSWSVVYTGVYGKITEEGISDHLSIHAVTLDAIRKVLHSFTPSTNPDSVSPKT